MEHKIFKTISEAHEYLFSEEKEADIIVLPPDNFDDLTDEERIDDDPIESPLVNDIAGSVEVILAKNQETDYYQAIKKQKMDAIWTSEEPKYSYQYEGEEFNKSICVLKETLFNFTPVQIFEELFTDNIFERIRIESERYAREAKNKIDFSLTKDDIKVLVGFLIFTGYHNLPCERDYWSEDEDLGVKIVKDAMSRNTYLELKSLLHFANNNLVKEHKGDKMYKIRTLFDALSVEYQKWGIFHKHLSIGEMIVNYYGHHRIKKFIRGKSNRIGYKLWALCGDDGYCYDFSLYCGKKNHINMDGVELGPAVVLDMVSMIKNPSSHILFFDNFFTTHDLLCILKEKSFRASGCIRDYHTKNCPLPSDKVMKERGKGYFEFQFDIQNEITLIKWNDDKCFTIGTNFDKVYPVVIVQRWSFLEKSKIGVPQPKAIDTYNRFIGGVDHHNWLLDKHSIKIRGKKWYWCLFTRMIDMTIVNAYLLYDKLNNRKYTIKDFRREIARTYLKKNYNIRCQKGRPSTSHSNVLPDIRFDEKGHMLKKRDKQRRCQLRYCTAKPRTYCDKCNVTLCIDCFPVFHKK